jgi:hypothetical protein
VGARARADCVKSRSSKVGRNLIRNRHEQHGVLPTDQGIRDAGALRQPSSGTGQRVTRTHEAALLLGYTAFESKRECRSAWFNVLMV